MAHLCGGHFTWTLRSDVSFKLSRLGELASVIFLPEFVGGKRFVETRTDAFETSHLADDVDPLRDGDRGKL